uniref:Uncharacterized protein n=1 Tax=Rhizophagus irregularis (strain DAOM 181602 / DAOM 197198 / MUCL 43194) TaxID=747089 RepID=U9UWX0_RHIID
MSSECKIAGKNGSLQEDIEDIATLTEFGILQSGQIYQQQLQQHQQLKNFPFKTNTIPLGLKHSVGSNDNEAFTEGDDCGLSENDVLIEELLLLILMNLNQTMNILANINFNKFPLFMLTSL